MRRFIVGSRGARIFLSGLPVFRYRAIAAGLLLMLAVGSLSQGAFAQDERIVPPPPPASGAEQGGSNANPNDPDSERAFNPKTGQNLFWDCNKKTWVDSKTGEPVPGGFEGRRDGDGEIIPPPPPATGAKQGGSNANPNDPDSARAFNPTTGQNLHWDPDQKRWIDSKTGKPVPGGFKGRRMSRPCPPPPTEKVNKVSYELGLGYQHTRADEETEKFSLNGWNATLKVNLTDRLGYIADVSDTRGSQNDVDLRRELFLIGPEFSTHSNDRTTLFAHPLIGVVYDKTSFGGFSDSNHALALALGGGVQYRVNTGASIRVQADYVPTHFGGDWQHNLRLSAGVVFGLGRE